MTAAVSSRTVVDKNNPENIIPQGNKTSQNSSTNSSPLENLIFQMSKKWDAYLEQLDRHPCRTKSITAGTCGVF